jgi:phosphomannomutase
VQEYPSLKIGLSTVRGIAGKSLTPQLVTSFAAAFGAYCGRGPVLIGTDTRPSRHMIAQAVLAGLMSVGSKPITLGIAPLPALQFRVRETDAVGGICISASHNPEEWNALKFFGPDGIILRSNQFAELTDLYHQGVYPRVPASAIQEVSEDPHALVSHQERVRKAVDVGLIRGRRFRVAVDCCNAASYRAAPEFLRELGCEVIELNTDPAAAFPRNPEPLPENIGTLCRTACEASVDIGFALDADADRLAVVDEHGVPLGEDCTVALAFHRFLTRNPGPVVVSLSTSRIIDDVAAFHGVTAHRSRVGEVHVLERMRECGAVIGGEGNGGVIVPALNPCRDSFVAMALILELLAESRVPLSEFRSRWPRYATIKHRVDCRSRDAASFLRLVRHLYRGTRIDTTDGVLVRWQDRWLHMRGSQTEPVLRIIAEAPTEEDARLLIQRVLEFLRPPARGDEHQPAGT